MGNPGRCSSRFVHLRHTSVPLPPPSRIWFVHVSSCSSMFVRFCRCSFLLIHARSCTTMSINIRSCSSMLLQLSHSPLIWFFVHVHPCLMFVRVRRCSFMSVSIRHTSSPSDMAGQAGTKKTSERGVIQKTAIFHFLQASTKSNLLFFCNKSLTTLENDRGADDSQCISLLES